LSALFDAAAGYLIARIPEISFLLSSIFMLFASDVIMGRFLLRRLRKSHFLTRTLLFVLYGIMVLPAMTVGGAYLLRELVLKPFRDGIIVVLAVCFLIIGVLLSLRYNMKMKVKLNVLPGTRARTRRP